MLNVKIILIIIGLIIIILGLFNHKKDIIKYKKIYKILPRNVYDEVFLSYPIQYNKGVFDNMDPEYVIEDDSGKFDSMYKDKSNFGDKYDIENTLNTQNLLDYLKYTGINNDTEKWNDPLWHNIILKLGSNQDSIKNNIYNDVYTTEIDPSKQNILDYFDYTRMDSNSRKWSDLKWGWPSTTTTKSE